MPPGKSQKGAPAEAPASGGDRIGALPDALLHRVLSFLPAQDAVRTCVLARRWIDLWKSAPGLLIAGADGEVPASFEEIRDFVDSLLLLRESSPLETLELRLSGTTIDMPRVRLWIRYAVQRKVQELRLKLFETLTARFRQDDPPLISRHLTRLELRGLVFNDEFLNFSGCPSLQHLQIHLCSFIQAERILSPSLKHLIITRGCFGRSSRTRIHTPNLVSLHLRLHIGRTPVLERMPSLASAAVTISRRCTDCCSRAGNGDCDDGSCEGCNMQEDNRCVLLQGLSEAKTLRLTAHAEMFIFRRDSLRCPTFRQLKLLILDLAWSMVDVHALASILKHSPVLEELELMCSKNLPFNMKIKGVFNPMELPSTMSAYLKRVEVYCEVVDGRVVEILKLLSKYNISFSFKEMKVLAEENLPALD
ncbi:hypothetical protein ACP70R_001528 [Stipagrostis hirtigluma subsp. patula]